MVTADAIVIGLGAMGSAAAYQLARRGASVIGIDRFSPPHELGSSHGETRITRLAVAEGDECVPIVARSHEIWREIEAETGDELLLQCGGLVLSGARSRHPKKGGFLDDTVAVARRHGIAHELLSASEIAARFPQFVLEGDEQGYLEPEAGIVFPERAIATQLRLACAAGAELRLHEVVGRVIGLAGRVRVETDRDVYEAGAAIVAAGAWNPTLVGEPLQGLALHRQVISWFETERPDDYRPGHFPVFISLHGPEGDQSYGFPIVPDGTAGLKVATETYEPASLDPAGIEREVEPSEPRRVFERHVAGRLRGVSSRVIRSSTCLYTVAPDARFVIDKHPGSEHVTFVSACSGHGFKHSAAIGEALAEQVLGGRSVLDLTPFRRRSFKAAG